MNLISRTISGGVIFLFGAYLLYVSLFTEVESSLWGAIWGLAVICLGGYIFFNKKEDDIEQINE